jgi:hypothetical protein
MRFARIAAGGRESDDETELGGAPSGKDMGASITCGMSE